MDRGDEAAFVPPADERFLVDGHRDGHMAALVEILRRELDREKRTFRFWGVGQCPQAEVALLRADAQTVARTERERIVGVEEKRGFFASGWRTHAGDAEMQAARMIPKRLARTEGDDAVGEFVRGCAGAERLDHVVGLGAAARAFKA